MSVLDYPVSTMIVGNPDINDLRQNMKDMVQALSGYDQNHVYLADSNSTRGNINTDPVLVVKITDLNQVGYDSFKEVQTGIDEDGNPVYGMQQVGTREFTCNIQAFGESSWNGLARVLTLLQSPANYDVLRSFGITVYSQTTIRDISWIDNSRFKERHSVDLLCRIGAIVIDSGTGIIEEVEISGKLNHIPNDPDPIIMNLDIKEGA